MSAIPRGVTMGVTIPCPICGADFVAFGRRHWCSPACRQASYRRRHQLPRASLVEAPPPGSRRAVTVYACPLCEQRYLGVQRCDECNVFCARVGVGGCCPACDEPIAIDELMGQ